MTSKVNFVYDDKGIIKMYLKGSVGKKYEYQRGIVLWFGSKSVFYCKSSCYSETKYKGDGREIFFQRMFELRRGGDVEIRVMRFLPRGVMRRMKRAAKRCGSWLTLKFMERSAVWMKKYKEEANKHRGKDFLERVSFVANL